MFVCNLHFEEKYWSCRTIPNDVLPKPNENKDIDVEVVYEGGYSPDSQDEEDECLEIKVRKLEALPDNGKLKAIDDTFKVSEDSVLNAMRLKESSVLNDSIKNETQPIMKVESEDGNS